MGKVRVARLGDEQLEQEQRKKAEARREAKREKKAKKKESQEPQQEQPQQEQQKADQIKKEEHRSEEQKIKKHQRSKRYQELAKLVDRTRYYSLTDAVSLLKKTSVTRFDGTVEIHINLSLQALGGKPDYRGSVVLPHGTGKTIRVAIANDDIIKELEEGTITFDILVAHPSMMPKLAKFARMLGPKGLMPNPKNGTVHPDPEKRAQELSQGELYFKTEPNNPIIHFGIGKVSFLEEKLMDNIKAFIHAVGKQRIAKVTLSSTMGPGIKLDLSTI